MSVDAKGRITLPSELRDLLFKTSPDHKVCVSLHEEYDCLIGFGELEQARKLSDIDFQWKAAVQNGTSFNAEEAAVGGFSLTFTANCEASGRFVLHPDLRDMAMIKDSAFIYGAGRHFCIWNPDRYLEQGLTGKYERLNRFLKSQLLKQGGRKA